MTKWEYCCISSFSPMGEKAKRRLIFFKGSGKEEEIEDFSKTFESLGLDGWELVSHSYTTTVASEVDIVGNYIYMFKRPLSE